MTSGIDRRFLLACALFATSLASQIDPVHASDGVILIQESNGFPGGEKAGSKDSRQQVALQGNRLRVLDDAHSWALFIDLDSKKVQEAAVDQRQYVERSFAYYNKYRNDRERNLANQARNWAKKARRFADDKRKLNQWRDEYRRAGGDPDDPGKIVARLQYYPQDREIVTILVDRKQTRLVLEHYVIRENQCDTPVFDLWTTLGVKLPVDVFRFYRELGTFSPEVSKKLKEVPGTVIRCTAVLDTGSLKRKFTSKIVELRLKEDVRGFMEVPKDWARREPDAPAAGPPAVATARLCDICKRTIAGEPFKFNSPTRYKGKRRFAMCSDAHRAKLIAEVKAELKKRRKGK